MLDQTFVRKGVIGAPGVITGKFTVSQQSFSQVQVYTFRADGQ